MGAKGERITVELGGHAVEISHPHRVVFPKAGLTKLDLVRYYETVAEGALRAAGGRPNVLVRYMEGVEAPAFWQKRAPAKRPPFVDTVVLTFPSGRQAEEVVPRNAATLAWMVNLGCIELHPHPVRAGDLDHPDELRIDLDPGPGMEWPQVQAVARGVRQLLDELGLRGWPKTSGSRGAHIHLRIAPRWTFTEVRRAALALAREVERRLPDLATSKWWKEERHGVFLDYNQNAKDRTVAAAYSVRPRPDARVSAPVTWEELDTCDPAAFTVATMIERFGRLGDLHAGIDEAAGSLDPLLELSRRQEAQGLGDAPWPPHHRKQPGEPPRVQPSKRRKPPLVEIARAATRDEALAGLARWKARHPEAAARLTDDDVLVDQMRGRSSTWTRIRVNLRHVPEGLRPPEEPPDPDFNPWARRSSRARTEE